VLREESTHFSKLVFKSNKKKFSFRTVESLKVDSHPIVCSVSEKLNVE